MGEELYNKTAAPPVSGATEVAARLKILEERYGNLSRREQLAEQNMVSFEKEFRSDLRALQERLVEARRHVAEITERLDLMQGQVSQAADKHDLRVVEAYLNMIQPLQFMTRAEAKKLLE